MRTSASARRKRPSAGAAARRCGGDRRGRFNPAPHGEDCCEQQHHAEKHERGKSGGSPPRLEPRACASTPHGTGTAPPLTVRGSTAGTSVGPAARARRASSSLSTAWAVSEITSRRTRASNSEILDLAVELGEASREHPLLGRRGARRDVRLAAPGEERPARKERLLHDAGKRNLGGKLLHHDAPLDGGERADRLDELAGDRDAACGELVEIGEGGGTARDDRGELRLHLRLGGIDLLQEPRARAGVARGLARAHRHLAQHIGRPGAQRLGARPELDDALLGECRARRALIPRRAVEHEVVARGCGIADDPDRRLALAPGAAALEPGQPLRRRLALPPDRARSSHRPPRSAGRLRPSRPSSSRLSPPAATPCRGRARPRSPAPSARSSRWRD